MAQSALASSGGTNIQFVGPRNAGSATCQNYFVTLPPGSVVTRVVLSARDQGGGEGICADDRGSIENHPQWRDCHIGWSGFEGPMIQQVRNAVIVYGTLLNWSHDRARQGIMKVNYRPPKNFLPKTANALSVEVLYATTRHPAATGYFDGQRGNALSFGKCIVTVPPNHRKGELERRCMEAAASIDTAYPG